MTQSLRSLNTRIVPEDRHLDRVPGTGLLSDQRIVDGHSVAIDEAKHLKRGTGKYAHVVLIPQPSDDPRDPYASIAASPDRCKF